MQHEEHGAEMARNGWASGGRGEAVTGVSLVGMKSLESIEGYIDEIGPNARFELSYQMSAEFLAQAAPLIRGRVVSAHACCPSTEFFPNLASADPSVVAQSLTDMETTLETALGFGAGIVVLHAGYVTDLAMPSSYAARKPILSRPEFLNDVRHADGAICGPEYRASPGYIPYAERAKERLVALARRYARAGVRLAVENLNPRVGYLFHSPEEMLELAALDPDLWLCLDVGHLYITSFAFGFDYLEGLKTIIGSGKVASCHLHANSSEPGRYRDDHSSLKEQGFPLEEVLKIVAASRANLIVEAVEDLAGNTRIVQKAAAGRGIL
jgi:sugar phosphate isomerase/epimerase